MHSPADFLGDRLQAQREPFDMLWSSRIHISKDTKLTPLRTHTLRLLRVLGNLADNRAHPAWHGVYVNLHTAASLQSIELYTDVHGEGLMCSSMADYDNAVSRVKERFVAGKLVFQGAWNSFEIAGNTLFNGPKKATTQAVRHELAKSGHKPFFGLQESLFEAHRYVATYIDTKHTAYREAIASGNHLCIAAELLRQFRNGILHGNIQDLAPEDWGPMSKDKTHELQTELFHTQIRLVLFLLQAIIAKVAPKHMMVWPNDDDYVEELIFGLQKDSSEGFVDAYEETPLCLVAEQKHILQI